MAAAERIISVISPDSAPIKRIIQDARERSILIDATQGRRTKAVIVMDSEHIILTYLTPETIGERINDNAKCGNENTE